MPRIDLDEGALLSASTAADSSAFKNLTPYDSKVAFYVLWDAGASYGGSVAVETAHDAGFGGAWTRLALFSAGASVLNRFQADGPFGAVRTRVVSALASGAVSTWVLTA